MIGAFVEGLRATDCEVTGPVAVEDARRLLVRYARGTVALHADVPIAGLADDLDDVLLPDAPDWRSALP